MSADIRIEPTEIPDCVIAHVAAHPDARGSFRELFRADRFAAAGLPATIAQVNHSRSARGVVRGLHFQWEPPMAKLMRVGRGAAFLVAVDIRRGSPTCGRAVWRTVTAGADLWLVAPAGFARGLQALEDATEVEYLCTAPYAPAHEGGIRWDDPALAIPWPIPDAILSPKDRSAPTLSEWLAGPTGGVFAV
ncbi:MAG: dTDP-4-dehydrorhamnose 3,5-epimerase [Gemmatimonadaceae bacterium]